LLFLARTANAALTVRPALAVVAALTATGAFVSNAAFSGFRLGIGLKGLFEVGRHGDYLSF
jgi:energy-converting hydrogenase Eha subunit H